MFNENKKNLLNLTYKELEDFILDSGMKKFNAKQIYKWLHEKTVRTFDEMTNISKKDRLFLHENCHIPFLEQLNVQISKKDNTEKYLFGLNDGNSIETVLIKHKDRRTVCVSTQVGCPAKCKFCATGQSGFERNLELHEIINQVYTINSKLRKKGESVTNIVFMGMGEPLLNLENLLKSVYILSDKKGLHISKRKIVVSTVGIVPGIEKLMQEELPLRLAISLHAATNEKRNQIIPINKQYPLEDIFLIVDEYQKINKKRITFEYILIDDFNVSKKDGDKLAELVRGIDHTINLIPYNPVKGVDFERPDKSKISEFFNYLKYSKYLNVTVRQERGTDINGACGQLRNNR
ncbi:MAG: 23S rRNA (adenine(2503)-C(2))-methyltransferase RlmN [Fusobacteriota bacterium]